MIYLIAFLEWFSTLCVEILAIRNIVWLVWSDSVTVSVILWVILLALSYGYYKWWELCEKYDKQALINRLAINLSASSLIYFFISFMFQNKLLEYFINSWFFISWILATTFILFFLPVYLASQTIPILNQISAWNKSSEIWKILFYSTIGSFLWSFLTSVAFFPTIWVILTIVFNSALLVFLSLLVSYFYWNKKNITLYFMFFAFFLIIAFLYSKADSDNFIFYKSNKYHNISIYDVWNKRVFSLSWDYSSWINNDDKRPFFSYIKESLNNLSSQRWQDLEVLVIWAAWFTFPREASFMENVKNIDVVDIDPDLKEIAEKYFFEEKLNNKIKSFVSPARFFINNKIKEGKKYDFILVDVYSSWSIPLQLWTYEFYKDINSILKEDGEVNFNLILSKDFSYDLWKNTLSTIKKAFPESFYNNTSPDFQKVSNFIISNKNHKNYSKNTFDYKIYLDNKTSIELDNLIFKRYYKTSF